MRVQSATLSVLLLLLSATLATCARQLKQDKCPSTVLQKALSDSVLKSPKRIAAMNTACKQRPNPKCYEECICEFYREPMLNVFQATATPGNAKLFSVCSAGLVDRMVDGPAFDAIPKHVIAAINNPANKCDRATQLDAGKDLCNIKKDIQKIVAEKGHH